jgi:hypothetical protein
MASAVDAVAVYDRLFRDCKYRNRLKKIRNVSSVGSQNKPFILASSRKSVGWTASVSESPR